MEKKKLLQKAFIDGNLPSHITYCFLDHCQQKDDCIHYQCALYKPVGVTKGTTVFPDALRSESCAYFAPLRIVRMAWGFDRLFTDVKVKDAPALRAAMKACLGSKGQYYRYKLGQLKLLPEQQDAIRQIFAAQGYGHVAVDFDDEELDLTQC